MNKFLSQIDHKMRFNKNNPVYKMYINIIFVVVSFAYFMKVTISLNTITHVN